MKGKRVRRLIAVLVLGLGLGLGLLWGLRRPPQARAANGTLYVSATDPTCGGNTPCYSTTQAAMDNAGFYDQILVAGGTYTDVHYRNTYTQAVYVHKNVTIRGGYSADFSTWDPVNYPTTLDARKEGHVVRIAQFRAPTLVGLRITNGSTSGSGAGIYSAQADPVISSCHVFSNAAAGPHGGGIYVFSGENVVLSNNEIHSNTAGGDGGGIALVFGDAITVTGNTVSSNTAGSRGGGIFSQHSDEIRLIGNTILSNTGGGVMLDRSDDVLLQGNQIYRNSKAGGGTGVSVLGSGNPRLINNLIVDNRTTSGTGAPGIQINDSDAHLLHNTLARNTGGWGAGVYLQEGASAWMTNTVLVSHAVGIKVNGAITVATATLKTTLWGGDTWANDADVSVVNGGIVFTRTDLRGDPSFVDPDDGDYHITGASAGRDQAYDTDVDTDIDGDARPFGAGKDVGADEAQCHVRLNGAYRRDVQTAIDASASEDDLVQVAGTCLGVGSRNVVGYITKTLTIRGGYSGDFLSWDPDAYPTTLNAQGEGSVFYIKNASTDITPTLEALRLTGGSSGGAGGATIEYAHPVISACTIYSNTSQGSGGGVYLSKGHNARLIRNLIRDNIATTSAGGGGGIFVHDSDSVQFVNNIVVDNQVGSNGTGAGIRMSASSAQFWHTTLARNTGGSGRGLHLAGGGTTVSLTNMVLVSQTVGIEAGAGSTARMSATLWGDGPWDNGTDAVGSSIVTGTLNWWEDPAFVDPAENDYHINQTSAALDRGLDTGVSVDIDGQPRTVGEAPDLGADECGLIMTVTKSGPAVVNEAESIAYTLRVTNTGIETAAGVVLSDSLPSGASFVAAGDGGAESGGIVTWPVFSVSPGGPSVMRTFTVTATETVTNDNYVAKPQGLVGIRGGVAVGTYVNRAPVAEAGSPQSVHAGMVNLDGSDSSDPDHDGLEYHWQQTGGPAPVTLGNADSAVAAFDAPAVAGTYAFALTVTDTFGLTDSDTTTVTVTNHAPVADAGAPQVVTSGSVTLDGADSHDDDGDPMDYLWTQAGGPRTVQLTNAGAEMATFTAPRFGGVYTFTLAVTDTFEASDADDTTVTVNLPGLSIVKSGLAQVEAGAPITYRLRVLNSGSAAASSLVITDALPSQADLVRASHGGVRVGDVISWSISSLAPAGSLTRTFTVTASETVTNADYAVSCAEGVRAVGSVAVVTEIEQHTVYLPVVLRGR